MIAIVHEGFRNASVTRPPQPANTTNIECHPVGGRAIGVPLYTYIQMIFWG